MDPVDMLLDPIRVVSALLLAVALVWGVFRRRRARRLRDEQRIAERLRALQRWWVGP